MNISKDTAVTISYKVTTPQGKPLDAGNLAYLHGGYENIFPKVEAALDGQAVGFATTLGEGRAGVCGAGDFYWGGLASTVFWVDPREDLLAIFMTQLVPSRSYNVRGLFKSIVYGALVD